MSATKTLRWSTRIICEGERKGEQYVCAIDVILETSGKAGKISRELSKSANHP